MLKVISFLKNDCVFCEMIKPTLVNIGTNNDDIYVYILDEEEHREQVDEFGIPAFPATIIYKDDEVVENFLGAMSEEDIMEILNKYR